MSSTSAASLELDSPLVPVYELLPVEPVSGDGVWLHTADGRRLLDLYGGHAVAILGYGHPRLQAALEEQSRRLFFQSNAVPMAVRERAARALASFAPKALDRVFLVNSGAEANENALRIALRMTRRSAVVAVEGAFHGRTAAAGAVTWNARWYGFPHSPFEVRFVPRDDLEALAHALAPGDVAAAIVEPVQGVAGAVDLKVEFLAELRERTRAAGTLLVFDEVQCGMGRTGHPFAAQAIGITPDLLTVAKGLAGGFPAGAVLMTRELAATLRMGDLGSTFGGGPMACALIEAVVGTIVEEDLLQNVRRVSARIRDTCVVGPVTGIQGRGFLLGLRTRPPAKLVRDELLERGILAGTSADPHVLRLLPPLILAEEHVDLLARALAELS